METYKPITDRGNVSCAKKLNTSMMPPCERVLLNKIRRTKVVAKIWMSSIEASPPNDSPLDFGWKLVNRNYQLLWFEGDLSSSSLGITYECEKHDGTCCILLLLYFGCLFLLYFWHDLCINRCLNYHWPTCVLFNWFFMLFRNNWGKWKMWQNVQLGRWWRMEHKWWRWRWLSKR